MITSWNSEWLDLCAEGVIPEGENPVESFFRFSKERVMQILGVSGEKAEEMLNGGSEEVQHCVYSEDAYTTIYFGDCEERLKLTDVPGSL